MIFWQTKHSYLSACKKRKEWKQTRSDELFVPDFPILFKCRWVGKCGGKNKVLIVFVFSSDYVFTSAVQFSTSSYVKYDRIIEYLLSRSNRKPRSTLPSLSVITKSPVSIAWLDQTDEVNLWHGQNLLDIPQELWIREEIAHLCSQTHLNNQMDFSLLSLHHGQSKKQHWRSLANFTSKWRKKTLSKIKFHTEQTD